MFTAHISFQQASTNKNGGTQSFHLHLHSSCKLISKADPACLYHNPSPGKANDFKSITQPLQVTLSPPLSSQLDMCGNLICNLF